MYRINVQATESPNTATRLVPGVGVPDGDFTSTGTSGETSAAESTSGPMGRSAGLVPTGSTSIVTAAAVAAVAPASGSIGTITGRHRRVGLSRRHHDAAASANVAAHRSANSRQPDQLVR